MSRWKPCLGSLLMMLGLSLTVAGTGVQAQSGSLEPPPGVATNPITGEPQATTPTPPSWDNTFQGLFDVVHRFKLVMGGEAVLDKTTGLVWEQSPDTTRHVWEDNFTEPVDARRHCLRRGTGGQMGWRLPSIHELTSLIVPGDPSGGPDLPAGHPFSNVQSTFYWSATTNVDFPTEAWVVDVGDGRVRNGNKTDGFVVWCVRGGGPLSEY